VKLEHATFAHESEVLSQCVSTPNRTLIRSAVFAQPQARQTNILTNRRLRYVTSDRNSPSSRHILDAAELGCRDFSQLSVTAHAQLRNLIFANNTSWEAGWGWINDPRIWQKIPSSPWWYVKPLDMSTAWERRVVGKNRGGESPHHHHHIYPRMKALISICQLQIRPLMSDAWQSDGCF